MNGKSLAAAVLAVTLVASCTPPAAAGPISVFTQIYRAEGSSNDEIRVSDLGSFAALTTGGGVNNVVTVAADQTSASQPVVGYWPVIGYRNRAQYDAQRGAVAVVPQTPVSLYLEVWNGEYGLAKEVQQVYFNTFVTARVSAEVGQNVVDWTFPEPSKQVKFGDDTLVSITYEPVRMPDGVPHIFFEDGSPPIGFPGPVYYPTLLTATVDVSRAPTDSDPGPGSGGPTNPPGQDPGGVPSGVPEPASALLLGGFALGGILIRRVTRPARN